MTHDSKRRVTSLLSIKRCGDLEFCLLDKFRPSMKRKGNGNMMMVADRAKTPRLAWSSRLCHICLAKLGCRNRSTNNDLSFERPVALVYWRGMITNSHADTSSDQDVRSLSSARMQWVRADHQKPQTEGGNTKKRSAHSKVEKTDPLHSGKHSHVNDSFGFRKPAP